MKYIKSNFHPGFTCQSIDLRFLGFGFFFLVGKDSLKKRNAMHAQDWILTRKSIANVCIIFNTYLGPVERWYSTRTDLGTSDSKVKESTSSLIQGNFSFVNY